MSIIISPLTTAVMSAVDIENSGIASGINNTAGRIAGLLSIAVLGVFALATFNTILDTELSTLTLNEQTVSAINDQRIKLAAIEIPLDLDHKTKTNLEAAIDKSFLESFRFMLKISSVLVLLAAIIALFTIEKKKPKLGSRDP